MNIFNEYFHQTIYHYIYNTTTRQIIPLHNNNNLIGVSKVMVQILYYMLSGRSQCRDFRRGLEGVEMWRPSDHHC